ncbi:MAG: ferrous iron transport protein A [Cellulomonadaceae bacterium]|nr:ferrous iron transport protein A [Cellulomonadaceae bacterium]
MELRLCPLGSAVEVSWLDLNADERARMRELGIREGTVIHVVNCGAFGSKVIAIGADRFAIDGRTCACISVIPHNEDSTVVGSKDLATPPKDTSGNNVLAGTRVPEANRAPIVTKRRTMLLAGKKS